MTFLKTILIYWVFLSCCSILDLTESSHLSSISHHESNTVYLLPYNYDEYDMNYFYINITSCIRSRKTFRSHARIEKIFPARGEGGGSEGYMCLPGL